MTATVLHMPEATMPAAVVQIDQALEANLTSEQFLQALTYTIASSIAKHFTGQQSDGYETPLVPRQPPGTENKGTGFGKPELYAEK